MKFNTLSNIVKTLAVAGVCFSFMACEKNDNNNGGNTGGNGDIDETAVVGEYTGTMNILNVAPSEGESTETPSGTELSANVTADAIEFEDFPIRDLAVKVLGTEEGVDAIVEAIGKVSYSIPYEASLSEDKASVNLTLSPKNLTLSYTPETPTGKAEGESIDIEVEITTAGEASDVYDVESENLSFEISVASVKIGGTPVEDFTAFSLHFDMTKK